MDVFSTFSNSLSAITLIALLCGYFMGAIPFGLFISQFWLKKDLRNIGSGNIGATNVLRTGNKTAAILTLLLDAAKGALPCVIFSIISPDALASDMALLAGLGAIIGHMFPCWLRFSGGKGVATFFGVILAVQPTLGLLLLGFWMLSASITRFSSVASLHTVIILVLSSIFFEYSISKIFVFTLIATLVILRHSANIARLISGEESKISILIPSRETLLKTRINTEGEEIITPTQPPLTIQEPIFEEPINNEQENHLQTWTEEEEVATEKTENIDENPDNASLFPEDKQDEHPLEDGLQSSAFNTKKS